MNKHHYQVRAFLFQYQSFHCHMKPFCMQFLLLKMLFRINDKKGICLIWNFLQVPGQIFLLTLRHAFFSCSLSEREWSVRTVCQWSSNLVMRRMEQCKYLSSIDVGAWNRLNLFHQSWSGLGRWGAKGLYYVECDLCERRRCTIKYTCNNRNYNIYTVAV
jgi:hypothetical protein